MYNYYMNQYTQKQLKQPENINLLYFYDYSIPALSPSNIILNFVIIKLKKYCFSPFS